MVPASHAFRLLKEHRWWVVLADLLTFPSCFGRRGGKAVTDGGQKSLSAGPIRKRGYLQQREKYGGRAPLETICWDVPRKRP